MPTAALVTSNDGDSLSVGLDDDSPKGAFNVAGGDAFDSHLECCPATQAESDSPASDRDLDICPVA